jgi:hypothetical protein
MAEALHAQDAGDLETAKSKFETLLATVVPGDQDVQRRLASLKARMAAEAEEKARLAAMPRTAAVPPVQKTESTVSSEAPVAPAMAPVAAVAAAPAAPSKEPTPAVENIPNDPEGLLEWENNRQQNLVTKARAQLLHAKKLAQEERFSDSLRELSSAAALLPLNPRTQPLLREIEALRNDMEHRQRVAGYTQGAPAPHLSISQVPMGPEMGPSAPDGDSTTVEIHVLEMMPDLYADLLVAWGLIEEHNPALHSVTPMRLDMRGRPIYLRREAPLPTPQQIKLYWLLRRAGVKPGDSGASRNTAGMVGLIGGFDPAPVVRALSMLDGCRLVAAPKVDIHASYQALLSFPDEGAPSTVGSQKAPGSSPTTGLEIRISPLVSPEGKEFAVSPAVVQYEGRLVAGAANTVFSRHESTCRLKLKPGMTAVMGGLVRDSGRVAAGGESGLQRIPFMGELLRNLSTAARQRELVILLTWRGR